MSGLLYNKGGFNAQGNEIRGKGVSQEQVTFGKIVVANGTSDTPANILKKIATVLTSGNSAHALNR